jgi:hypothetical protein
MKVGVDARSAPHWAPSGSDGKNVKRPKYLNNENNQIISLIKGCQRIRSVIPRL